VTVALPRRCRDCDAVLAERQRWCVACGGAARIAVAPTPPSKARAATVAVLVTLALAAVVVVFATLL
jgi:predicted RNA-binding protein with PUA domain